MTILLCQGWGWGLSGQRPDIDTVLFNVCDMGCMCKTTKWRLKPFWVRVLCLLHCLQHWLHGLATLVTNFVGVGPIFKISAAKCISSFWKDYWYYSCYPYYSYYRNKSPTSIRAINPSTPLNLHIYTLSTYLHIYIYRVTRLGTACAGRDSPAPAVTSAQWDSGE